MSDILISPARLHSAMAQEPWLVFDVRHELADHDAGRRAYDEGHIPGALYLDHERQLSARRTGGNGRHPLPALRDFVDLMRSLGLRPATKAAIYDASGGMFAAHLWWMLRWMGHEHAAVLDGGWQAWLEAGGLVEAGAARVGAKAARARTEGGGPGAGSEGGSGAGSENGLGAGPEAGSDGAAHTRKAASSPHGSLASGAADKDADGEPEAGAPGMPTVDEQTVLANLKTPVFTVIDARAPERFRGEVEPMDPVAGHIPGALNRPNSLNLQADGRFKPAAQLREEFVALLGGRRPEQIVHQCGSGITASHNLFAMELAGLHGSALYPGSWSEWCSDAQRPVEKGD